MAVLGAATSAFKHACYLTGRTFGGELGYRALALSKWYSARVRDAANRQEAGAAAQGAMEKLLEAGAQREAAEQVVASLKERVAKWPAPVEG